jgi:hypothetical protein
MFASGTVVPHFASGGTVEGHGMAGDTNAHSGSRLTGDGEIVAFYFEVFFEKDGTCDVKNDSKRFIDSDGFGHYATKDKESDISAVPSEICAGFVRNDFKYVIWYNK